MINALLSFPIFVYDICILWVRPFFLGVRGVMGVLLTYICVGYVMLARVQGSKRCNLFCLYINLPWYTESIWNNNNNLILCWSGQRL